MKIYIFFLSAFFFYTCAEKEKISVSCQIQRNMTTLTILFCFGEKIPVGSISSLEMKTDIIKLFSIQKIQGNLLTRYLIRVKYDNLNTFSIIFQFFRYKLIYTIIQMNEKVLFMQIDMHTNIRRETSERTIVFYLHIVFSFLQIAFLRKVRFSPIYLYDANIWIYQIPKHCKQLKTAK